MSENEHLVFELYLEIHTFPLWFDQMLITKCAHAYMWYATHSLEIVPAILIEKKHMIKLNSHLGSL